MSKTSKAFNIGDILSVTHGNLVSPRHIGGVYDILGWMTGEDLMAYQLPRASRECEDWLRVQHPDLLDIVIPKIASKEECLAFLESLYPTYGETREVTPLNSEDHTQIDALLELKMIRPDARVIGIEL